MRETSRAHKTKKHNNTHATNKKKKGARTRWTKKTMKITNTGAAPDPAAMHMEHVWFGVDSKATLYTLFLVGSLCVATWAARRWRADVYEQRHGVKVKKRM